MEILQNFIYPETKEYDSTNKYIRPFGDVYFEADKVFMQKFSIAVFDTYYNALSIPLWSNKVGIKEVALRMKGKGKVTVELWQIVENKLNISKTNYPSKLITQKTVNLSDTNKEIFDLDISDSITFKGLVYPRIVAIEESEISQMSWVTKESPRRNVKLGISITHFNRKDYVIPAIQRIKDKLLSKKEWSSKIDFTVVDNSKNLTKEESLGVTVIPNENTGGSGGFMRGLLYYKNETDITHVLFMDDDASLEVESIKRTYRILSFAEKDNSAVGSALFYEDNPNVLIERGARLNNKRWVPDFHNKDLSKAKYVLQTELIPTPAHGERAYSGWWFTAFPIKYATKLVPPFFVRGDDVSFAQLNDFNLIYGNGIAAYAENFLTKVAGMTTYLDMRNILIVNALFSNHKAQVFTTYVRQYIEQLLSGRYGYADILRLSLKDFGRMTPQRFIDGIDLTPKFPVFKEMTKNETPQSLNLKKIDFVRNDVDEESILNKIVRAITFNKLFLPLKKTPVYQDFMFRSKFREVAGYKRILSYDSVNQKGFISTLSRWKTIHYLFLMMIDGVKFVFKFPIVRRRLIKHMDYLTSEDMWNDVLKLNKKDE